MPPRKNSKATISIAKKLSLGKSTATIFIGPLEPGRYSFFGEYNEKTAQGVIVAQ